MPQASYLAKCLQDTEAMLTKVDEPNAQAHLSALEAYIYAMQGQVRGMPQKPAQSTSGTASSSTASATTPTASSSSSSSTAAPASSTSTAPAPSTASSTSTAERSISVTAPVKTGAASVSAMGCVTYPDSVVSASKTFAFAGTYTGTFKSIMIAVPGVAPWGGAVQDGKGGWTCTMDLSSVRTGPLNVRVMAWYDDPTEKQISLDFTLLIDNPAVKRAALAVPAPAAGMKLLLADDFDALPDGSRWGFGVRPDGSQWGSDSHFQTKDEKLSDVFQLPMPSCLRIRAVYDPAYVDPQGWNRKWRSGMLCTAFSDGRAPVAAFRKGYVEMRAIMPLGKGMWPSMWAESLGSDNKSLAYPNHLEVDGFENYNQQADPGKYYIGNNVILWTDVNKNDGVNRQVFTNNLDLTSDWHTYGCLVSDTQATFYLDGQVTHTIQIPATASKNPLFWMFDNALGGGWPVTVPPAKAVDMWVDYVRLYSAD